MFPIIFLLKRLTFCKSNIFPTTVCEHIALAKFSCDDVRVNFWYGFFVLLSTVTLDVVLIFVSYMLILHAVFSIPSRDARHKTLNTCGSHVCVIILFYGPGIFSAFTPRFARHILPHVHVLLANVCILAPTMLIPSFMGSKLNRSGTRYLRFCVKKRYDFGNGSKTTVFSTFFTQSLKNKPAHLLNSFLL